MLVIMGPVGSGKGTVIRRLCEKHSFYRAVDTGEILRKKSQEEGPVSREIRQYLDKGLLVPDELVSRILEEEIAFSRRDSEVFLLDGFPRNLRQVYLLEEMLKKLDITLKGVFWLEVSEEQARERMRYRRVCSECGAIYHMKNLPPKVEGICDRCGGSLVAREDDAPEIIRQRWKVYKEQTQPVREWYKRKSLLFYVDASGTPDEVLRQIEIWEEKP